MITNRAGERPEQRCTTTFLETCIIATLLFCRLEARMPPAQADSNGGALPVFVRERKRQDKLCQFVSGHGTQCQNGARGRAVKLPWLDHTYHMQFLICCRASAGFGPCTSFHWASSWRFLVTLQVGTHSLVGQQNGRSENDLFQCVKCLPLPIVQTWGMVL